jgi:RHS repeat-associated protein
MSGTTLAHAYLGSPGGGTFLEFGGTSDYLHKDWLGNARIASLITDKTVSADMAYAPYGEVYNFIQGSGSDWMFTGDVTQLDSEYLFDTPNRELAINQGRWLSPDPAGQGWNQYAYVTNPLNTIDPSGLACYPLEKYVFGTCAGFLSNGTSFGMSWDELYIFTAGLSGSYEAVDPSKPWIPVGDLDGQIIVGGCNGTPDCEDFEIPQTMTVYPNIGLLSLLSVASRPAANNGQPQPPSVPKPPNPIENPSTKDKICAAAGAAVTYFGFVAGPGALSPVAVPSIITGGLTTAGEVGGFVIAPEVAVPVLAVAVPGALLLCL